MIDLHGLQVGGYSVGGFASSLDVPTFKLAVDIGTCLDRVVARELILVTHPHVDHLGAVAQHAAQRGLRRLTAATYILPPGTQGPLEQILAAWRELDGGKLAANLVTLAPGELHQVRKDLAVRPFATDHTVVSQGYFFERIQKRLKDPYQGLEQDEIRRLRLGGIEVSEPVRSMELAVTGDTRLPAVLANAEVLSAERLVLECTFFDDRIGVEEARNRGHVHIDEIAEAAHLGLFKCKALLINHVSPRHSREQALDVLQERLPADLMSRTQLMMGAVD